MPERLSDEDIGRLATAITEGMTATAVHGSRSNWDRWAAPAGILLAIFSIIFSAGFNYSRIADHERQILDNRRDLATLQANFAAQDKATATLTIKIDNIQRAVDTISGKLDRVPR